jgi:hypothetical protein
VKMAAEVAKMKDIIAEMRKERMMERMMEGI